MIALVFVAFVVGLWLGFLVARWWDRQEDFDLLDESSGIPRKDEDTPKEPVRDVSYTTLGGKVLDEPP